MKEFGLPANVVKGGLCLAHLTAPVVVVYAEHDSPEFSGRRARLVVATGLNHFEIPETLARPDGVLGRAALELMQLG